MCACACSCCWICKCWCVCVLRNRVVQKCMHKLYAGISTHTPQTPISTRTTTVLCGLYRICDGHVTVITIFSGMLPHTLTHICSSINAHTNTHAPHTYTVSYFQTYILYTSPSAYKDVSTHILRQHTHTCIHSSSHILGSYLH